MIMSGAQNDFHEDRLKAIAREHDPAGFCLTEESAGSDITAVRTLAYKQGNSYIITGKKSIVINNTIAQTLIVFAAMPPAAGRASLKRFVVDANLPGISRGDPYDTIGFSSGVMGSVVFDDVRVPDVCLLEKQEAAICSSWRPWTKAGPLVAASCTGEAQKALDLTIEYTKKREQFGNSLNSFQVISFSLAEHATEIHSARLLYRDALNRIDEGRPFTMEASMAKLHAAQTLMDVAAFGVEIIGYRSVTEKNELSGIYHDSRLMGAIDGTANVQKMVIASQL
jgi:butyryl-CoA dehydrogenase